MTIPVRRVLLALLLAAVSSVALPTEVEAEGCSGGNSSAVHTAVAGNGMNVSAFEAASSDCPSVSSVSLPNGEWHQAPVCAFGGSATCTELAHCQDGSVLTDQWFETNSGASLYESATCPSVASPTPQVTAGMVAAALRRIDLPPSDLVVQPPGGETLVNFATNFYTEQGSFTRRVHLLGQRVDLKIWPSQYRWVFGDGESQASESAGAPYPDLLITHDYRAKGGVSPRVDTTYSAQFSVNGGPWRDVDGTVTIAGSPVDLRVRTARPVLVSYH